MDTQREGKIRGRRGVFHSFRFQLALVLTVGVALPLVLSVGLPGPRLLQSEAITNSVIVATISAIGMLLVLRQIGFFPSASVVRWILPTLASLYGASLATIAILRLDYSNAILGLSFFATLAVRYAIATLNIRGPQPTYFLVPGGRVSLVEDISTYFSLVPITDPQLPNSGKQPIAFIADLHHDHAAEWERLLAEAAIQGHPVYHYKQFWEALTGRVQIERLSENSFGALLPSLGYTKLKRLIDITASIAVLPFLIPLFAIVALAIRLDTPGPVLFRQYRVGYKGQEFRIFKFRTMTVTHDGSEATTSVTGVDDERITRLGRFLRRSRIDELPQVFNILLGEMSWIGPRPEAVGLSKLYEEAIPFYRYRHIVRPGISGWAQVNQGHVTSFSEIDAKLQFDFYYIKRISYWLDLLIVFKTMRTMLSGFGAR